MPVQVLDFVARRSFDEMTVEGMTSLHRPSQVKVLEPPVEGRSQCAQLAVRWPR